MLAQAVIMTGSDLCSSSKSWECQLRTSDVIYEEFHEQVPSFVNFFVKVLFRLKLELHFSLHTKATLVQECGLH